MKSQNLAYAAGFVDGEGCFQIGKNGAVSLAVTNTSRAALESLTTSLGVGKIARRNQRVNKTQWIWTAYGAECVHSIMELMPYLIDKKPQAETIIEFKRHRAKETAVGRYRESPEKRMYFRDKIAALKKVDNV